MRYACSPEYELCGEVVLLAAQQMNGSPVPVSILYKSMMAGSRRWIAARFIEKELHHSMSIERVALCVSGDDETARSLVMVPGFYEHLQRLLNRVVRFQLLRACHCAR